MGNSAWASAPSAEAAHCRLCFNKILLKAVLYYKGYIMTDIQTYGEICLLFLASKLIWLCLFFVLQIEEVFKPLRFLAHQYNFVI